MNSKFFYLLLTFMFVVASAPIHAQTQFIKYKKYLIPIGGAVDTTSPQCVGLSATENNVIYIDDIGLAPQDHNGFQDLAIVLGLSDQFNLLAVGVGVPGKTLGLSSNNIPSSSISVTQAIVNATRIAKKPPVFSGSALISKVVDLANCSSSSKKLIIATGGLWHDVASILDADDSISNNIRIVGITGSNIDPDFHDVIPSGSKTALQAIQQVRLEVTDVVEIGDPEFRGVINNSTNTGFSISNFQTLFNRAGIDSNTYLNFRVADYGAAVLATELRPRGEIFDKTLISPLLIDALDYATNGNAQ